MKAKWRLPEDVTRLQPKDLAMPQIKTMLEFLGVALRNQPAKREDKDAMLRDRIQTEPVKAQSAYDVIVHSKLPDAAKEVQADVEAMKAHFYGAMTQLLTSEQADTLRGTAEAMMRKMESQLETYGKRVLKEAADNYRPIVVKQGTKKVKVQGVLPKEFELMVQLGSQRIPIMLVGPAGCGKTYLAGKLAEALGLPFYDQSCSEGVNESIFTGWLLPVDKGGTFDYVESPFVHAYENGGVFLLDEMDASDPNLLTFLNKAIANDSFYLPQRHKKPLVKKHKDFVVVAAANTYGHGATAEYVGRNALDAATLDRFRTGMLHLDYSAEVEQALVDPEVLVWGRRIRKAIGENKLRRIMSTRVMLDMTKMKQNCEWSSDQWNRAYFADWSEQELRFIKEGA